MQRALSVAVIPLASGMILLLAILGGAPRLVSNGSGEANGRLERIGNAVDRLAGTSNADPQAGSDGFNCLFQRR